MAKTTNIIAGLNILAKYADGGLDALEVEGQHDIIFVVAPNDLRSVSDEDKKALDDLHWHWSTDGDCWSRFT